MRSPPNLSPATPAPSGGVGRDPLPELLDARARCRSRDQLLGSAPEATPVKATGTPQAISEKPAPPTRAHGGARASHRPPGPDSLAVPSSFGGSPQPHVRRWELSNIEQEAAGELPINGREAARLVGRSRTTIRRWGSSVGILPAQVKPSGASPLPSRRGARRRRGWSGDTTTTNGRCRAFMPEP